jgi:hypothetical protein
MEAGRIGGWQSGTAARGALPLVGSARIALNRAKQKRLIRKEAVAEEARLPSVGKPEWKPAGNDGTENID